MLTFENLCTAVGVRLACTYRSWSALGSARFAQAAVEHFKCIYVFYVRIFVYRISLSLSLSLSLFLFLFLFLALGLASLAPEARRAKCTMHHLRTCIHVHNVRIFIHKLSLFLCLSLSRRHKQAYTHSYAYVFKFKVWSTEFMPVAYCLLRVPENSNFLCK